MNDRLAGWDAHRVTLFAPDAASVKAAQKLAAPAKWLELGSDGYSRWGQHRGSGSAPYEVKVDLLKLQKGEKAAYHCTCPSQKQPCKHVVALLFLFVQQPAAFPAKAAPEYVQSWLDKLAQRARKEQEKKKRQEESRPAGLDPATYSRRQESIAAGAADLAHWLADLIRQGVAGPHSREPAFWQAKAARLVDAQAPGLANWLEAIGSAWIGHPDQPAPVLAELGQLYLFTQAFGRFGQFAPAVQADLRTVAGWHVKQEECAAEPAVRGEWLVLGQRLETAAATPNLRQQRLWLVAPVLPELGRERLALVQEFAFGDAPFDTNFAPGQWLDADLVFYPGRYPLRAFARQVYGIGMTGATAGQTIGDSLTAYAAALAQNPWLRHFPFQLGQVWPRRYSGKWIVQEGAGSYLPLDGRFNHRWALLAVSGGRPVSVMGEWDGQAFLPLSALVDGQVVDFGPTGNV
jgi:hypothetical protein